MTRVLITGAAGQDGHYLTSQLIGSGAEVHGTIRPGEHGLAVAVTHELDLRDSTAFSELLMQVRPDVVYNLAAISSVAQSWDDPVQVAEVNVTPLAVLLERAAKFAETSHRMRVVQASSAEIFGSPAVVPQREDTLIAPVSPYGASKAHAHQLLSMYRARGVFAASAILFGHESPLRPERFVTRKITAGVARIVRGKQDELVLGRLDVVRDWGWAPDYTTAMRLIGEAAQPSDFVVATGVPHTVEDFVAAAFARAGVSDWRPLVRTDERFNRPVDPVRQLGDSTRIRRELGWAPSLDFTEIVGTMVDHDLALLDAI